jgi:alkylation response protein AidB-like acyl-CoA dehydrogenase
MMDSPSDTAFREEIRTWLETRLTGEFASLRGRGGSGDEHALIEERRVWEAALGEAKWVGVAWPEWAGGRGASLSEQVIFNEEYARARGPGRLGHIGETLLAPTLVHFGAKWQVERFLPAIQQASELWCQGYSEPGAGSDLANVSCRAEKDGDSWVITGQKVWTSHAAWSDWCFALCRTDPSARKHRGISYLLVPMKQPGVEVRPIKQITGSTEFAEVFFDGARTPIDHVVGEVNGGWKVAMGTLAFERGASTLGQQLQFRNELESIIALAKSNGRIELPQVRQHIGRAWIGLEVMRLNALRMLAGFEGNELPASAMITKIYWATWHRDLGELAMRVMGPEAEILGDDGQMSELQRMFLFSRSDTIYAGSNQIQRNLIAQRALGLPRPKRTP